MRLLVHLVLRLVIVVALCLACAVGWVLYDAHRAIGDRTEATAERVARGLNGLYWHEILWRGGMTKQLIMPKPEWRTVDVARLVAPGVCVTYAAEADEPHRLCGQEEGVGEPAPGWFASVYETAFGPHAPVTRPLTIRDHTAGMLTAEVVPATALRQAWAQLTVVAGVAAAMAAGVALLAALMIGHALMPARAIIDGLRRLELGDHATRLPAFRTVEFSHIARAVNDLAGRLAATTAERAALTKKLFQVQEEERRALARDLHDEFGQCLTATAALAAAIEDGAGTDRPDLADDARAIARVQGRMMTSLKEALAKLRSQDIDELGLEASLEQLVGGWNERAARQGVFRLAVAGELASAPAQVAINVYRIAQECLTNAARHGAPTSVLLSVERNGNDAIALTVEDDGGGDAARVDARAGNGILGIRERVQALGGSLSIGPAARGVKIAAIIPFIAGPGFAAGAAT